MAEAGDFLGDVPVIGVGEDAETLSFWLGVTIAVIGALAAVEMKTVGLQQRPVQRV